jgi:hypothetical protein
MRYHVIMLILLILQDAILLTKERELKEGVREARDRVRMDHIHYTKNIKQDSI